MKRMFGKKKELTPEQNRELMEESGIKVNSGYRREAKFGQFSDHAKELASKKRADYVPGSGGSSNNPYANAGAQLSYQPSGQYQGHQSGGGAYGGGSSNNAYGGGSSNNAYGGGSSNNAYGGSSNNSAYGGGNNAYGGSGGNNAHGRGAAPSPYAAAQQSYATRFGSNSQQAPPLERTETMDTYDRNRRDLFQGARAPEPSGSGSGSGGFPGRSGMKAIGGAAAANKTAVDEDDELNQMPSELDASAGDHYAGQEQEPVDSEDEDVEAIKGQIRFTKEASVNSTRNALRIAAEAEESGRNTLGMLGSQGERLANTEHNLSLAETQNRIAEEKARELKTLNRSMFAVHVSNPFGAKRRLQEKEERMKADKRQEQYEREARRQTAFESQQRVQQGLHTGQSQMAQKYKTRNHAERSKYQFEEDSEDEAMEDEIDNNLDGISNATQRLKKLAMATNEEVSRQNERLDNIAESTDTLDVNVHLNTSRLANIK